MCVVGGVQATSGSIIPIPRTGCATASDPLASMPEPPQAKDPCGHTEDVVANAGQTKTLNPGVYCKKTEANGGTIVFNPGIYVVRDAPLTVNSSGKVTGTGVMIFLMGKDAVLTVNSDSTFDLSAPTSGTYAGIALFQSRDPVTLQSPPHKLNSSSGLKLTGAVYMPNGYWFFNSASAGSVDAPWTAFVLRKIEMNSHGSFTANTNYAAGPPLPAGLAAFGTPGVRLIK